MAKLSPRLSSLRQVPRTRLVDRMHTASDAALVLVRGPAGFGKTTAMLQYYAQSKNRGVAVGWLTLDRADNDLVRFLRYFAEACRSIDPGLLPVGEVPQGLSGEDVVLDVIGHLSAFEGRFILFLDDFEEIENPVVLGLVQQIIDYLPQGGQLVIGSRAALQLGIGNLRVHDRLVEIDTEQLRFDALEIATFLRYQGGFALRDDDIRRLQKRTEGWPAALRLVALSLRDRADPQDFVSTFDGANASITEYLLDDVLSRQDERMRHFLLHTSVLQELSASLCDVLLQCTGSGEMLARAERAQLFVVSQDKDRNWYRYHPLFGSFLRAQLHRQDPQAVAGLHLRAAHWWLEADRPAQAIEHALLGNDESFLLSLLQGQASDLLWRGRARTLARWYAALPKSTLLHRHPLLMLDFAWALTLAHRYDESLKLLDMSLSENQPDALRTETQAQRAFILAMMDRVKPSSELWRACMSRIGETRPFADVMLGASFGYCLVAESRFDEAWLLLDRTRQRALEIGGTFIAPMALCLEGAIDLAQGRLRNATAGFRAAFTGANTMPHVAGNAVAAAFLAEALYEAGQIEEAERLLTGYMPMLKDAAAPDQLITSFVVLARISMSRGNDGPAMAALDDLEEMGHRKGLPRLVASARLERGRIALVGHQLAVAQDHLSGALEAYFWEPFDGLIMHANDADSPLIAELRWRIHGGRAAAALPILKKALSHAEELHRNRRAMKISTLMALALYSAGQQVAGLRRLRDVIGIAAREGFVRALIDEGSALLQMIAKLREREVSLPTPDFRILAFLDRLLGADDAALDAVPGVPSDAGTVIEGGPNVLSGRELQVLRLLADGRRNREIAEHLFVSETTIKAHLRNINVKLGTQSRTHAIAVARQMRLVG